MIFKIASILAALVALVFWGLGLLSWSLDYCLVGLVLSLGSITVAAIGSQRGGVARQTVPGRLR